MGFSACHFPNNYHLPPGEHECLMEDVEGVFLGTDVRLKRWEDFLSMLKRLYDLKLVPDKILINGSFVTGRNEPGDVDFAALIPPNIIREAHSVEDNHDREAVKVFLNPENQDLLRNIFGAHLLIAYDKYSLDQWSSLFRKGQSGKLREPEPNKDPKWVTRPLEKGIISVNKEDIIRYIDGGDEDESSSIN